MIGWIDNISQKKLYEYDMETKTINIIADGVNKFFINNDTVIYDAKRKKIGLVVYDLTSLYPLKNSITQRGGKIVNVRPGQGT